MDDRETIVELTNALVALAVTGLSAGLQAFALMAENGLVSPDEVDRYANSLTIHFGPRGHSEILEGFREIVEQSASEILATAKRRAFEARRG